jgi:23S rRNA (adenine2503-C2)-methyltransferase
VVTDREEKVPLLDLSHSELQQLVVSLGEPAYRADQLYQWLYSSLASRFADMLNLPQSLRERLEEVAELHPLKPLEEASPASGLARKVLFGLRDGETIESVLLLYDRRQSVCVSTQVGCPVGCAFCATGQSGFTRDLSAGEIIGQVLFFARQLREQGQKVTNVVFMGMGEPLLNYEATWRAVEKLNDPQGFNLGARRMTISTAGVVPGIDRLSQESLQVGLAVSLHAPTARLRRRLVPIARRYALPELIAACDRYSKRTGRRVTFEYALFQGLNDSLEQAQQLVSVVSGLLCHVNLIPLNPTEDPTWQPSSPERALAFHRELRRHGVSSTVRVRRGIAIEAGCGQLRSRHQAAKASGNCVTRPEAL